MPRAKGERAALAFERLAAVAAGRQRAVPEFTDRQVLHRHSFRIDHKGWWSGRDAVPGGARYGGGRARAWAHWLRTAGADGTRRIRCVQLPALMLGASAISFQPAPPSRGPEGGGVSRRRSQSRSPAPADSRAAIGARADVLALAFDASGTW